MSLTLAKGLSLVSLFKESRFSTSSFILSLRPMFFNNAIYDFNSKQLPHTLSKRLARSIIDRFISAPILLKLLPCKQTVFTTLNPLCFNPAL